MALQASLVSMQSKDDVIAVWPMPVPLILEDDSMLDASPSYSCNHQLAFLIGIDVGFCNDGINAFDPITEVVARLKKMGVQVGILSAVDKED